MSKIMNSNLSLVLSGALATLLLTALPSARSSAESEAFAAAWKLYEAGKPSQEAFESVLAEPSLPDKDRFNSAYVLGVLSLGKHEADQALVWLERAEAILPDRPQVAIRRCDGLIQLDRLDDAQELLARLAPEMKQASPTVRRRYELSRASLLEGRGNLEQAIEVLDPLAQKNPKDWEVPFVMARVFERMDLPDEAMYYYDLSIKNDPERDPYPGIYAYQRWAAMLVSTSPGSYQDKSLKLRAIARYETFLARAEANGVAPALRTQAAQAVKVLREFGAPIGD